MVGGPFRVKVGSHFLDEFGIVSGVPQGSVLGPIPFLVFISDLPDSIRSVLRIFADDVKIYRPISDQVSVFLAFQDDLLFK